MVPTFAKYDYGSEDANKAHYGQTSAPLYHLSNVRVPTALFAGGNDYLADPADVARLQAELPASSIVYNDLQSDYAHLDYTWAFNANTRIYGKVRLISIVCVIIILIIIVMHDVFYRPRSCSKPMLIHKKHPHRRRHHHDAE